MADKSAAGLRIAQYWVKPNKGTQTVTDGRFTNEGLRYRSKQPDFSPNSVSQSVSQTKFHKPQREAFGITWKMLYPLCSVQEITYEIL